MQQAVPDFVLYLEQNQQVKELCKNCVFSTSSSNTDTFEMIPIKLGLLSLAISFTVFSSVHAAAYYKLGECPNGYTSGDEWSPGGCMKCHCDEEGYGCYSCGVAVFPVDSKRCYTMYDTELPYPHCCTPKAVCKGDQDFDESKLSPIVVG